MRNDQTKAQEYFHPELQLLEVVDELSKLMKHLNGASLS